MPPCCCPRKRFVFVATKYSAFARYLSAVMDSNPITRFLVSEGSIRGVTYAHHQSEWLNRLCCCTPSQTGRSCSRSCCRIRHLLQGADCRHGYVGTMIAAFASLHDARKIIAAAAIISAILRIVFIRLLSFSPCSRTRQVNRKTQLSYDTLSTNELTVQ